MINEVGVGDEGRYRSIDEESSLSIVRSDRSTNPTVRVVLFVMSQQPQATSSCLCRVLNRFNLRISYGRGINK